ncbi:MAG: hypothetical protein L6306_03810 [Planctomycetales bacterium]|nr:hypothetical protein [Planctomycetales bacterium]
MNDPIGAASYIQNGSTGILVPGNDPVELKQAIVVLLNDARRRTEIAQSAKEYAEQNLSPEHYFCRLRADIASLVAC